MENIAPGRNGGGWIDQGGSGDNLTRWLEQGYLTMFAKAKELMLFNFSTLLGSPALGALGAGLYRVDALIGKDRKPRRRCRIRALRRGRGGPGFQLHRHGRRSLRAQAGSLTWTRRSLFLSETSACDPDVMAKLEKYVRGGGNAIATTGFVRKTYDKGIKDMTSVRLTARHVLGREYLIDHYNTPFSVPRAAPALEDVLV